MKMDEYLRTVTEQVRCSRVHDSIVEELKDHILDQAEAFEEEGADHEQALELAVQEMGDPVETGVALDRIHRPHLSVELLVMVGLLSVLSLVFYGMLLIMTGQDTVTEAGYWAHQQMIYTVTGFVLMLLVYRLDYSILGKWGRYVAAGILVFLLLSLFAGTRIYGKVYGLPIGPVLIPAAGMIWLYVPAYASILYTYRGRGYRGLLGLLIWTLLPVFLVLCLPGLNQAVLLFLVLMILCSVAIWKGWYQVCRKKVLTAMWGTFLLLPVLAAGGGMLAEYQIRRLEAWLGRGEQTYVTQAAWKCLQASRLIGTSETSVWKELPGWNSEYILVSLASVYGLLAVAAAVLLVLFLCIRIFRISSRQKNQLGMIIGYGCGLVLLFQCILTVFMSAGLLPAASVTMPFLSFGGSNLISSYILTGLVLSIYRYKDIQRRITYDSGRVKKRRCHLF